MRTGLTSVNVVPTTDDDGNMTVDVQPTTGEVRMDNDTASTIATAVATAVKEWLTNNVVVTVENGASGGDTLTGYLE